MEYSSIFAVAAALAIAPIAFAALLKLLLPPPKSQTLQSAIQNLTRWLRNDPVQSPRPVVLVDLTSKVGKRVAAHLMPEYEGIVFFATCIVLIQAAESWTVVLELQSIPRAKKELAKLVAREKPCELFFTPDFLTLVLQMNFDRHRRRHSRHPQLLPHPQTRHF